MSDTKEPYKWYVGYKSTSTDITHIFNDLNDAQQHAHEHGEYDEITCKESMIAKDEELFFEVCEDELEEYAPIQFHIINQEVTNGT